MERIPTTTKLLPPANEVCEGYVFTGVCLSTGGVCGDGGGGHVWWGAYVAMCVCGGGHVWWGGPCVAGGHVWQGGMHGRGYVCGRGACMAGEACMAGGMHGRGACMVGGHVWQTGVCVPHAPCQILQDMVNERAVRILLECIAV